MTPFQRIGRLYRSLALFFLNTVLIGAVVIGVYFLVTHVKATKEPEDPIVKYGITELLGGYPGHSTNEIATLIKEAWAKPFIYEAYTQFRESPSKGRFINVSEAGFRMVENQGPWPPNGQSVNIFVFGGSTTFGYGVTDRETIPSALQRKLRQLSPKHICVYNFGRGFYYSTQERILFSNLLAAGIIPDLAVFIDGLNDFYRIQDEPQFSGSFTLLINQAFCERRGIEVTKAADVIHKTLNRPSGKNEETARNVCERYWRNKTVIEAMAKVGGTGTVFVWQPIPTYKFDLKFHPFSKAGTFREHFFPAVGYHYMAQFRQTNGPTSDFLWLADMQENAREQLYVDAVHYTAKMCDQIAGEIARFISERPLISQ